MSSNFVDEWVKWMQAFHDRVEYKVTPKAGYVDCVTLQLMFFGEVGILDYSVEMTDVSKQVPTIEVFRDLYAQVVNHVVESLLSEFSGRLKDPKVYAERLLGVVGSVPGTTETFTLGDKQIIMHNTLPV